MRLALAKSAVTMPAAWMTWSRAVCRATVAVSAASNRSKADKDPAEWLPTDGSYHCTYAATWVGTKLRWDLAVDEAERQALLGIAEDFPATTVVYEPAR